MVMSWRDEARRKRARDTDLITAVIRIKVSTSPVDRLSRAEPVFHMSEAKFGASISSIHQIITSSHPAPPPDSNCCMGPSAASVHPSKIQGSSSVERFVFKPIDYPCSV